MRPSVRRAVLGGLLVGTVILVPATEASAHVHGITPLLECSVVPDNAGANQTDFTQAAEEKGGPITGLIPSNVGESSLMMGDGGRDAPVRCP